MKIVLVAGARPNFMKVAPLLRALEQAGADVLFVHTGQHADPAMSDGFLQELGSRPPDVKLSVEAGSQSAITASVMTLIEPVLLDAAPAALVVVGDVTSTLACTLTATKIGIPVAHVEAGLRSRNRRMPEEVNRICTDHLSDWLFTTSADADANLKGEGIDAARVFPCGNVMIDSLLHTYRGLDVGGVLERYDVSPGAFVLATLHRPGNVDDPATLTGLLDVLERLDPARPVLLPVHPRTARVLQRLGRAGSSALRLLVPLGHRDFVALMSAARVVITDSGGVQEETTVLGTPCLTVRDSTERPVTVTHGTNRVVGADPAGLLSAYADAEGQRTDRRPDGWDGHAADRIAKVLLTVPPPLDVQRRDQS